MLQNFECPICKNNDMIVVKETIVPSQQGYVTRISTSFFGCAETTRFVCKSCGYLMEFFSQQDVKKIAEKYENGNR